MQNIRRSFQVVVAGALAVLAGCAGPAGPGRAPGALPAALAPTTVAEGSVPGGMQYLYGSGEAGALSEQTWHALVAYVAARARARPAEGVVLDGGATLAAPRFAACGQKPLAVIADVDETVLLNPGFEADEAAHPGRAYDPARWRRYERGGVRTVVAVPGAREALAALRAMGVTPVFNSNRSAANAPATEAALDAAGLGPAHHGDTLFLAGDDASGPRKDGRRAQVAARWCVVAMAGDQLGDFSDLFDAGLAPPARRAAALAPGIARMWGAGWFVLPNPVYGAGLRGDRDEVFPRERRWTDAP